MVKYNANLYYTITSRVLTLKAFTDITLLDLN
jgi:hypothetical protein